MKHKFFIFNSILILIFVISISSFAGTKEEINDYMEFKYNLTTNPNLWSDSNTYKAWVIYSNANPLFISSNTPLIINLINGRPYIDNTSGSVTATSYKLNGVYFGSTSFGELFNLRLIDYPANSVYNSTVRPDTGADISYIVTSHDISGNSGLPIYPMSYLDDVIYEMYNPPATDINSIGEQYMLITNPPDDYKTVSKTISYSMMYRIKTQSFNDLIISIKSRNNKIFDDDESIQSYMIRSQTGKQNGDFYEGYITIDVNYKLDFIGETGIIANIKSVSENKFVADLKDIEIVSFIDSNADGINDETNEKQYVPPVSPGEGFIDNVERSDYSDDIWGEIKYQSDKILNFLTAPLRWIADALKDVLEWINESIGFISSISLFFSTFLGFLPLEILTAIQMLIYTFVIFAIVKLIRG